MRINSAFSALFSSALLIAAMPAAAQNEAPGPKPENENTNVALDDWFGDPLIVTADGFEKRSLDTPYIIDVVGEDEIRDYGIRSVPEALKYTPGVMIQKTSHKGGSPYIRGFTSFRNLMLIDGVRLNNSTFREGPNQYWSTIDPFSIERLEVIKGPSSVIYGSDAIGGVVNAITRSPYGYSDTTNLAGRTQLRYASNERSIGGRFELSPTFTTADSSFGVLVGGGGSDFGDLQGGRQVGRQPGTDYSQYAADAKLEYFIGDHGRLVVAHQRFRQNDAARTHRTVQAIVWEGLTQGTDLRRQFDQERDLTYIQLHADGMEDSGIDAFKIGVSWQNTYEERDRVTGGGGQRYQDVRVGTLGFFAQAQSEVSDQLTLTYGFDYYHDEVGSFSNTNGIQGPVADDSSYDLLGLYLQGELEISDRTTLVLGGRWNYAAADAGRVDNPLVVGSDPTTPGNVISIDDSWNAFVGSARLLHDIKEDELVVFGGVSQGFRAPNLSDLTRFDQGQTNIIETAAPNLDPEYYVAFEAGFKGQGETFGWQASYFYTIIQDRIVRVPTGVVIGTDNEFTKQNIGNGYVNGIELDATWRPVETTTFFANATWLLGEEDNRLTPGGPIVTEYLSRNMPITVNAGARYDVPDSPLWLYGVVTAVDAGHYINTSNRNDTTRFPPGGNPAYITVNIGGGWNFSENMVLSVTLENITNEDYRVLGSGVNGAGFGVVATLDWTF